MSNFGNLSSRFQDQHGADPEFANEFHFLPEGTEGNDPLIGREFHFPEGRAPGGFDFDPWEHPTERPVEPIGRFDFDPWEHPTERPIEPTPLGRDFGDQYPSDAAIERLSSQQGTDGADFMTGSYGADIMSGGRGADTMWGSSGDDTMSGGSGSDQIYGGSGRDHIDGGRGADLIDGGYGADVLAGGAGRDTFSYGATSNSTYHSADLITDFQHGVDKIDLSRIGFAGNDGNQHLNYVEYDPSRTLKAGEVSSHYDEASGKTIVEVATGGPHHDVLRSNETVGADMRVELQGNVHLDAQDFNLGSNVPEHMPIF